MCEQSHSWHRHGENEAPFLLNKTQQNQDVGEIDCQRL